MFIIQSKSKFDLVRLNANIEPKTICVKSGKTIIKHETANKFISNIFNLARCSSELPPTCIYAIINFGYATNF